MTGRWWRMWVVAVAVALVAALFPATNAEAFLDQVGRALVQTVVNIDRRAGAYERIEAQRDQDLAAIDAQAAAVAARADRGAVTTDVLRAEQARLAALREAVVARAEREKAMNRATYNRAIGSGWREAAEAAVVTSLTGGGYAATLYGQLRRGEDPLSAALTSFAGDRLDALLQAGVAERATAADDLDRALGAIDVVRDPKGELRATVQELSSILRTGQGELPAVLSDEARATAEALLGRWQQILGRWQRLTASQVRVSTDRLLNDPRWAGLTAEILRLGSIPIASRATLATRVGLVQDRVGLALEGQDVDDALRAALIIRVLAQVLQVERDRAAGLPVVFDLDAYVRAQLDDLRSSATTEVPTSAVGDGDEGTGEDQDANEGGVEGADRPTGGGVFTVTEATAGSVPPGPMCLSVSQQPATPGGQVLMLEGCATSTRYEVVFDLAAGTVAGWFEADLVCPHESCATWFTSTGTVRGEFGPLAYGQPPVEVPDGWPFPDGHWYAPESTYWAGGPIELTIELSGDYALGDGTKVPSSWSTTVTGWVSSDLDPSASPGSPRPTSWYGDLGVSIDQGQDANPRWYFYFGVNPQSLPETNLDRPPWDAD